MLNRKRGRKLEWRNPLCPARHLFEVFFSLTLPLPSSFFFAQHYTMSDEKTETSSSQSQGEDAWEYFYDKKVPDVRPASNSLAFIWTNILSLLSCIYFPLRPMGCGVMWVRDRLRAPLYPSDGPRPSLLEAFISEMCQINSDNSVLCLPMAWGCQVCLLREFSTISSARPISLLLLSPPSVCF